MGGNPGSDCTAAEDVNPAVRSQLPQSFVRSAAETTAAGFPASAGRNPGQGACNGPGGKSPGIRLATGRSGRGQCLGAGGPESGGRQPEINPGFAAANRRGPSEISGNPESGRDDSGAGDGPHPLSGGNRIERPPGGGAGTGSACGCAVTGHAGFFPICPGTCCTCRTTGGSNRRASFGHTGSPAAGTAGSGSGGFSGGVGHAGHCQPGNGLSGGHAGPGHGHRQRPGDRLDQAGGDSVGI